MHFTLPRFWHYLGVMQLTHERVDMPVVTPTGAQRSGGVFQRIRTKDSSLRSE